MNMHQELPPYANGYTVSEKELIACQQQALALPKLNHRARQSQQGHHHSSFKGRGMEFAEVRRYQAGDDIRSIDWRVTARTGQTHTKLYNEEKERSVIIVADLGLHTHLGSQLLLQSVQIAHISATLAWRTIQQGNRIGAITANQYQHIESKPKARKTGIVQVIDQLCQTVKHESTGSYDSKYLTSSLKKLRHLVKPGAQIWLVTDGTVFNGACLESLSTIKKHCDIGVILVTDPIRRGELELPKNMNLPIFNGQEYLTLDRYSYQYWLEKEKNKIDGFKSLLEQINIIPRHVCSAKPLISQLMELR